jgi:chromate transporter
MAMFAGYLAAGIVGAVIATFAIFTPLYLFVVIPGKTFRKHADRPVRGFINGATAAAAGAIAGAAVVIGRQTIDDWSAAPNRRPRALRAPAAMEKIPEPALVAAGAVIGLIFR